LRISLSKKVLLAAIILCLVTIVSGVITYQFVNRVSENSLQVLNVELPIEDALLGMDLELSESTRAVLDYVQDYQDRHVRALFYSKTDFESNVEQFLSISESDQEIRKCNEAFQLFSDYMDLGNEIIALQDHQNDALVELRKDVNSIMSLFEEFADYYTYESESRIDDKRNMLVIFQYVNLVAELHTEVEGVLAKHSPEQELDIEYYSDKLQSAQLSYTSTIDSTTERAYVTQIYTDVNDLFVMSEELMTIAHSLNSKLDDFETKREQIENKLEYQLRPLVNINKEETARTAFNLSQLTLRTSVIDSLIGFAFIGGLLYTINLWIVSPILELGEGIQNFASGNYDMKINIKSEDEIGDLAFAFNDMTDEIEEKIDTITENEKKLEALNKDLEKEIQTRKEYEKEIIRVARESEVDRLRSQFLSTITHELRTPLTSIKGYIEVIRSGWVGEVSPEMNDTLDIIVRNSDRLSALTSDLLDVQRIASGRLEVELALIDLKDVIEQSVKEINPEIAEKKQVLKLEIPKEPLKTMGDSQRLNQVLLNLLNNASKFSKEESTIYLKVETDNEKILVSIKDSGIGIKKADVERVFTPLAMIEKPVYVKGTGLGLSISKGIIDLHNGEIWAESEGEWKGSKFIFQLPKKEEP